MDIDALAGARHRQAATHGDPMSDSEMQEDAQSLWKELQGLTHDRLRLAALETQRAGENLVTMIVMGVMVAILLIGAWLGLMAATVLRLIESGMVASNAILLAIALNLLFTLLLFGVIRRKSYFLQYPGTLRSLQSAPPEPRNVEKS
jgi:uncharacterized membrane protein YqjE